MCQAAAVVWPSVWSFLNSSFTTALAGAGLGAVAGAWAAQKISKRDAAFEAALVDIRHANSAITFTVGVANALTGLKRQFAVPLVRDFNALVERYNAYLVMAAADPAIEPFHFDPDMKFIAPQDTPINELGDVLRANAGSDPAAWLIFQTLRQILANIDMMLAQRNAVLEEIRTAPPEQSGDMVALYFGRRRSDGNTDGRHAVIMKDLPRNVDDGLGFSRVLAEHISERAKKVANHDRGGNCVPLALGGPRTTNLHSYWDASIVQALGEDSGTVAQKLIGQIKPTQQAEWEKGDAEAWARESYEIAKGSVYTIGSKPGCERDQGPVALPTGYGVAAQSTAASQLEKAGVRLAKILNDGLGAAR